MGNNIKNCQEIEQDFFDAFTELEKNPRGRVFRDPLGKILIMKEFLILEQSNFNKKFNQLLKSSPQTFDNILNLNAAYKKVYSNFCTSNYKIFALFEYSFINLQDEIRLRNQKNRYFQESDIFNILLSVMNAYKQYKFKNIIISPESIFVMDDGTLKILNPKLQLQQAQYISEFYSPERFEALQIGQFGHINPEKQIIFSLGMCILNAAILIDCLECYDFKKGEFKYSVLEDMINFCSKLYSKKLVNIIRHLVHPNPKERINYKQLEYILQIPDFTEAKNSQVTTPRKITVSCSNLTNLSKGNQILQYNLQGQFYQSSGAMKNSQKKSKNQLSAISSKKKMSQQHIDRTPLVDINNLHKNESDNQKSQFQSKHFRSIKNQIFEQTPNFESKSFHEEFYFTTIKYPDGTKYQGTVRDGKREGNGKFFYSNSVYYEGKFQNDKMQGFGILYYKENQPAYRGYWFEDQFHGEGILYNENPAQLNKGFNFRNFSLLKEEWIYYRGQFEYDKKKGKGCLFLTNGQYYEGNFQNDYIEGFGEFHLLNNQIFKGEWKRNVLL